MTFRLKFLLACAVGALSLGPVPWAVGAVTNSAPISEAQSAGKSTQDSLNALLQTQDQLPVTQLLIESNRVVAAAEAERTAADLNAQLQMLEQTVAAQHAAEIEATQKTEQWTLILAGAFGAAGLVAVFLMAYFQWRTVIRLIEVASLRPSAPALEGRNASPMPPAGGAQAAPGRVAGEWPNARWLNVLERLEKQLFKLEHAARAPLPEAAARPASGHNAVPTAVSNRDGLVANLLAQGQLSLSQNEPEKALACFDQALALNPKHTGTLMKKADTLERLNRFEEALACYDAVTAADSTLTIAYLQKGGLFNRLSRYEEALQCYEHALHTHVEKASGGKAAV